MTLVPAQCRAARGLLGWTMEELAARSGCAQATISRFEHGEQIPRRDKMAGIENAFAEAGVIFLNDPLALGVMLAGAGADLPAHPAAPPGRVLLFAGVRLVYDEATRLSLRYRDAPGDGGAAAEKPVRGVLYLRKSALAGRLATLGPLVMDLWIAD